MTMGRLLGTQKGTLRQVLNARGTKMWRARFRVYGFHKEPKERMVTLGKVSDISEAEAREMLSKMIERTHTSYGAVRYVGQLGALRHTVNMEPISAEAVQRGSVGAVAEMLVCCDLMSKGIEVEVKKVGQNQGTARLNLRRNYGRFDLLAMVTPEGSIAYVPQAEITDLLRVDLAALSGTKAGCNPLAVIEAVESDGVSNEK